MSSNLTHKQKVIALLESLENDDKKPLSYINPNKYIQHNLTIEDGVAGIKNFIGNKPKEGFKVNVVRVFQDADYVFTHSEYKFYGDKVGFDIFRFEDGLIVEHWDNLVDRLTTNVSGHSQTDGSTELNHIDDTEYNKTFIGDFIHTILINREYDKLGAYFYDGNFTQHDTLFGDGASGRRKGLATLANDGITVVYVMNHIILGEGNFVLAISEGKFKGEHTSFYDLFRLRSGKIMEHWDVVETIASKSEWKNNNGKFNFF